jgi:radical SAM protein
MSTQQLRHQRSDPADRPFLVIWESTQACPLSCRHCRAAAQPDRNAGELTTDEATELMRQVASFGSPSPLFIITGGDPFQRPDLIELVCRGADLGLAVAVSPSGTPTLTRQALTDLQDAGARAISLSVYELTLAGWRAAREIGLRVQINTTITRHNLLDLPDIAQLVHDVGAMTWSGFLLVPTGRGATLNALTPDEVEDVFNWLYDVGTAVPTKTTEGHHFRRVVLQRQILADHGVDHVAALGLGSLYARLSERTAELGLLNGASRRQRRPPMDINAGRGFVFISHLGTVHPSGFLPVGASNVRDTPLPQIYRTSALFTSLRDPSRLTGRCGTCEFASVCGGSRSRAYGLTGDPYAAEPWCRYQPGSFPFQDDLAARLAHTA